MLLACGLVFLSAVAAAPALAAPGWSSPVALSGQGTTPSVAIVTGGTGIEAWSETVGGAIVIRDARHIGGGAWTTDAGTVSGVLPGSACSPFASIDPSGNALVVWTQWAGATCFSGNQTILFSTRAAAASSWSQPAVVGASATPGSASATAAVNASGQMVVSWGTSDASFENIDAAVGSPTGGFTAMQNLVKVPIADSLYYLTAGIGPTGMAAVQWEHYSTAGNIEVSIRPSGGTFPATPTALTTNTSTPSANNGSLSIDAAGNVLSGYSEGTSLVSQIRPAGSTTWQPAQTIDTSSLDAWIEVGLDGSGNATAVWLQEQYPTAPAPHLGQLFGAVRAAGPAGAWSGQAPLTDVLPGAYAPPNLFVAPSGAAVVSWEDANPQNAVQALYRPAGGTFGSLTPVAPGSAESPSLAASGDAAIALVGAGGDPRVSVLDETAPAITSAAVQATATTGQPVSLGAVASDAWSGVTLSWSFGDGATGAGTTVNHTYAKAGTYTVTIGATDGVGLSAAPVSRQIVVSDPPIPPTPATSVSKAAVKIVWRSSRLVGTITVRGAVGAKTRLTVAIRRRGAKKNALKSTASTPAGNWKRTLKLPASLLPGAYDVLVSGPGVLSTKTSFTLAAPASGLVSKRYASGPQHGPAATRLASTSDLWAHFTFGTLPGKHQKITTQWTLPGGHALAANVRPRTTLVEAEVKQLAGKPLPTGTWHCVLRVGTVVVATVTVRLS
jgi:hypothetical protein